MSRSLYDTAEGAGWDQAKLIDQVRQCPAPSRPPHRESWTTRVVWSPWTARTSYGFERAEYLVALAESFDFTLGSLRGLVSRVRVGGEQIGCLLLRCWWLLVSRLLLLRAVVCGVGDVGDD